MSIDQFEELAAKITGSIAELGPVAQDASEKLRLSMAWIGHSFNCSTGEASDLLLKGAYGSAVESVSLLSFGLLRSAMLALRSHYEICLQYLFFKDHPRELQSLLDFRVQGPLPGVVKKYLKDHSANFEARFTALSKVRRRTMEDVYGVLSGVAHGNALNSISSATRPVDLVEPKEILEQAIGVYEGVGETISDFFLADFHSNWMSVPPVVQNDVSQRLQVANVANELSM